MRPSSAISADGYLNLVNAIKVAAEPSSKGRGCLLVMNDTIFNGRDVTKNATYRVEAFQSRTWARWALPMATEDRLLPSRRCANTRRRPNSTCASSITSSRRYGALLRWRRRHDDRSRGERRSQGIVSAGTGAGRPTPAEDAAFDKCFKDRVCSCACAAVSPRAAWSEARACRTRLCRRRQFTAVEGAASAFSGSDQDDQSRRDSAYVRHLLIARLAAINHHRRRPPTMSQRGIQWTRVSFF